MCVCVLCEGSGRKPVSHTYDSRGDYPFPVRPSFVLPSRVVVVTSGLIVFCQGAVASLCVGVVDKAAFVVPFRRFLISRVG